MKFGQNDVNLKVGEDRRTFAVELDEAKRVGNTCSPSCSYPSDTFGDASIPANQDCERLNIRN